MERIDRLIELLEPISKIFKAILNPVETVTYLINIALAYIPALCMVLILFYVATGSKKVLSVFTLIVMTFLLFKAALVFELVWLAIVVIIAIILIRYMGVIM